MSVGDTLALVLLGIALGAQVFLRPLLVRRRNSFFILSSILVFGVSFYWSWVQYGIWAASKYTGVFLEPNYFFWYAGLKFFAPPLIALIAAIFIGYIARYVNRRFDERFFEPEEISFLRLGIFLTGYPGFFLYLVLIFLGGILLSSVYLLSSRGRAPLYYLWLPTAIFAILIKIYILPPSLLTPFILR